MIDTKVNWKETENGAEGNFRIPQEEIEFSIFIDCAANQSYGILIDMYFDVYNMQVLTAELNKIDIFDGYIFNKKENKHSVLFEYLDSDHKFTEVFGEGIIHVGVASSLRDAKIYSEIIIDQIRNYLHV